MQPCAGDRLRLKGVFLMKRTATPIDTLIDIEEQERSLFYYADCVITSVVPELTPDEPSQPDQFRDDRAHSVAV